MANRKSLLVEGSDDEHVLKHICGNRGIPALDVVKAHDGHEQLLEEIPIQLKAKSEEGDIVGIVIDADTDLVARWQAIRDRFISTGYQGVPPQPDPNGTILEPPVGTPLPKAGVWIMPDNKTSGILEDFLRFLVPQADVLFDYATTCVNSISDQDQRFSDSDKPKAIIHTWLAWQKEPGRPYGTAITARFLNPDVHQVDVLVSWLKRLFAQQEFTA